MIFIGKGYRKFFSADTMCESYHSYGAQGLPNFFYRASAAMLQPALPNTLVYLRTKSLSLTFFTINGQDMQFMRRDNKASSQAPEQQCNH
jgi:hypothetical protein